MRRRKASTETAEETLLRVRSRLEGYQMAGTAQGGSASVSVAHVLDLLDPGGTWRFDRQPQAPEPPPQDPGIDPMTGCRPVV